MLNDDDSSNIYEKLTGIWSGVSVNSCSDNSISKQWKELILTFSSEGVLEGLGFDESNTPFTINGNILPQGEISFNLRTANTSNAFSGHCDMIGQMTGSTFSADFLIRKLSNINNDNISNFLQKIGPWNGQVTGSTNITKYINNINFNFNIGHWKGVYLDVMSAMYTSELYIQRHSNSSSTNVIHISSQINDNDIICADLDPLTFSMSLIVKKTSKVEMYFGSIKPAKLEIDCKGPGFCSLLFSCNGKIQQCLRRTPNLIPLCLKAMKLIDTNINNDNNDNYDNNDNNDNSYSKSNHKDNQKASNDDADINIHQHSTINNTIQVKKKLQSSSSSLSSSSTSILKTTTAAPNIITYDSFDQSNNETYVNLSNDMRDSDDETLLLDSLQSQDNYESIKLLGGVWCGLSCSDATSSSTSFTIWRDMNIDINTNVIGTGVSEWRSHDIPFTIDIETNSEKLDDENPSSLKSFTMTKTHKGRFKNSIKYKCDVISIHQSCVMQFLSSNHYENDTIHDASDYVTCIVGSHIGGSNGGVVRLIKVSDNKVDLIWFSWLAEFRDNQCNQSEETTTNSSENVSAAIENAGDICRDDYDNINRLSESILNSDDSNLKSSDNNGQILLYRLLISELLVKCSNDINNGQGITERELVLLEEYRVSHNVTMQDHQQILASLGWTPEQLVAVVPSKLKINDNEKDEKDKIEVYCASCKNNAINNDDNIDANKCRICYEMEIDCILLPCAHFAVCMTCALKMDTCPFDRTKITRIQQIYRVT